MTPSTVETAAEEMTCPTCHARQPWSDECRRCKCDFSLLRQFQRAADGHRRQCLRNLRAGDPAAALAQASRYAGLVGADRASPLLAVCHLLCHNWPQAAVLAPAAPLTPEDAS